MKLRSRPVWLLVVLAVLFGVVSLGFGLYLISVSSLFGIVGIVFGAIDLITALLYWKTGRLSWFILLFGPVVFIPAIPMPVLLPEAWTFTLFLFIFPMLFLMVTVAIFFWMSNWLTRKVAAPVVYRSCRRCGAGFPQEYRYCPFCGEPVKLET